jgi:hypothetical protein
MIEPVLIQPEALYDDAALRQALGLTPAALAAARRIGVLRYTRKGKRTLYKGAWILAWLECQAEQPRPRPHEGRHEADGRGVGQ